MVLKHNGRAKRAVSLLLVALFLLALSPISEIRASAVTRDQITELQEQLAELEEQVQAQQEIVDSLAESKAKIVERKVALDKKIDLVQRQVALIESTVAIYDEIVNEKAEELDEALNAEAVQAETLRTRIRAMEENGNNSYISFIFEARSLTDLLGRIADINDIMHYDRNLEATYRAARENVEEIKAGYEEVLAEQESLRKELSLRTDELQAQIEAAYTLISDINDQSDDAQAEYDAINKARADADAEIDRLLAALAAQEAAEAAARANAGGGGGGGGSGGGGGGGGGGAVSLTSLMWPVPSCSLITSRFGYRVSPTAGASTYHGGLDIGAAQGATIVSAQSGTVIAATYNNGYGNYVMVDHGGGIVTLYGHMQSIAVGYGQKVSQGQTIGYVGSTGVATGPHCHFEIRVNGAQTDPAPYFSGLTYWNC